MRRAGRIDGRQSGNVLVLFAICSFGLLGVAALVIDLGMARTAQVQMQTATDLGALEGVRARDANPADGASWPNSDEDRRLLVADMVDPVQGGGAEVVLSGGSGGPEGASQDLSVQPVVPADRRLELNLDPVLGVNLPEGDMLAGRFLPNPGYRATGYDRSFEDADGDGVPDDLDGDGIPDGDFTHEEDPAASPTAPAFLVRLRRISRDLEAPVAGVSNPGPELPLLFGRGTTIGDTAPLGENHAYRQHGITVRATAIAEAGPALRVGSRVDGLVEGLLAAVDRDVWDGTQTTLGPLGGGLGYWIDAGNAAAVGDLAPPIGTPPADQRGFVAVLRTVPGFGQRVTGFLLGQVSGGTLVLDGPAGVAPRNASRIALAWSDERAAARGQFEATYPGRLLAPALVR